MDKIEIGIPLCGFFIQKQWSQKIISPSDVFFSRKKKRPAIWVEEKRIKFVFFFSSEKEIRRNF